MVYWQNKSGSLDAQKLIALRNVLWRTYNPDASVDFGADVQEYLVQSILVESDTNLDSKITFDEFIPWYASIDMRQSAVCAREKKSGVHLLGNIDDITASAFEEALHHQAAPPDKGVQLIFELAQVPPYGAKALAERKSTTPPAAPTAPRPSWSSQTRSKVCFQRFWSSQQ